jgi:OST3 / OST6 family, transporter family
VGITALLGFFTFATVAYPYILPIIQNRNLWAGISLILVLLFTSGHMFNHIRKVPYVSGNGRGGISYFAGGFSNQYGMETQIVASMCKSLGHSVCLDAYKVLRCSPLLLNNRPGSESPPDQGPQNPTSSRHYLELRNSRHVQLPYERFQSQEWRLSVLASPFLS